MAVTIRPAVPEDLHPAAQIVQRSINDLRTRHGLPANMPLRPPHFQAFCLAQDPRGLWVAEDGGRRVGFAFSWFTDGFWFLAQLFLEPEAQARGIGRALLAATLEHAEARGARTRALVTFAYNLASTALYVQHGLYPRVPLYRLAGEIGAGSAFVGLGLDREDGACTCDDADDGERQIEDFGRIDQASLGFRRPSHHRFSLTSGAFSPFVLRRAGRAIGYAYLSSEGHIGPLAVEDPEAAGDALRAVLRRARELGRDHVSLIVPGPAESLLSTAARAGLRAVEPLVLLSTRPFGDFRLYLPRDPGFL